MIYTYLKYPILTSEYNVICQMKHLPKLEIGYLMDHICEDVV